MKDKKIILDDFVFIRTYNTELIHDGIFVVPFNGSLQFISYN